MNLDPYILANTRPLALPAVRAGSHLPQRLPPMSARRPAELYFGGVKPVFQYRSDMSGAMALSLNTSIQMAKVDTTPYGLNLALDRPWLGILSNPFHGGRHSFVERYDLFPEVNAHDFAAIPPVPVRSPFVHVGSPKPSNSDTQSFTLIERVKHLLHQQNIREARRSAEIGSVLYPECPQIANLLRAISPGRVSPKESVSIVRERETAWIRQHGPNYRGKWVALDKDRLIAFASTLDELLTNLGAGSTRNKTPFIQYLLSE